MSLKNIYARVDQECFEKINALAEMRAISTSELIRGIVAAFFDVNNVVIDDSSIVVEQTCVDTVNLSLPNVNLSLEVSSLDDNSIELDW